MTRLASLRNRIFIAATYAALTLVPAIVAAGAWLAYETWRRPPRVEIPPAPIGLPDATRGYVMQPNLSVRYPFPPAGIVVDYATDAAGMRAPEPGGRMERADILFIGDSQTFAMAVPWHETFPARVAARFNVRAANAGVGGYGTVSMLRQLQAFADLKPGIVVFAHYYDHLDRAVSPCNPGITYPCIGVPHVRVSSSGGIAIVGPGDNKATFETERRYWTYAHGKAEGYSFARDMMWKARALWGEFYFLRWGRRQVSPEDAPRVAEFIYRHVAETTRAIGAKLIVLYIPDYFGDNRAVVPPPDYLARIVGEVGATFVDITPDLQAVKDRAGLAGVIIRGDGHLNPAMHGLIADRLAAAIAALGR